MSGIYLHIPFCKSKCPYCDFYSVTFSCKDEFLQALQNEIRLQKNFFNQDTLETVYFGGGTPSLLKLSEVEEIWKTINIYFNISSLPEVTFECNPDDLTLQYLQQIHHIGINRISLGLQSFQENELDFLGRRHSVRQNHIVLEKALDIFDNVSVDLIYGLPGSTLKSWVNSLEETFQYPVHHLSAYHLTIEPGTPFFKKQQQGNIIPCNEEVSKQQFRYLNEYVKGKGFIPYEISNFAPEGYFSKHNTAYWKNIPYLGLGPSAHSYDGTNRQWNVADLKEYLQALNEDRIHARKEILTQQDHLNEYLITGLRTMWGINLTKLKGMMPEEQFCEFEKTAKEYISKNWLKKIGGSVYLTDEGKFMSDTIIRDLLWTE
jgi:oxygen-independent coproporphyrinogen-3 oxidase